MHRYLLSVVLLLVFVPATMAATGLVSVKSPRTVNETVERLEQVVREHGLNFFIRLDHAAGAKKVGKVLRPTQVVLFGHPKGGTPLMACRQSAGIDLPHKALIWEDDEGQVWLSYNDPAYLAGRHGITDCGDVITNMASALQNIAKEVTMP